MSNSNYVKKVIFPLHLLPVSTVLSALVHMVISFVILIVGVTVLGDGVKLTILYAPIVLMPIVLFTLGLAWILASLGTYIRDIGYIVNVLTSALMFLSPIFYPIDSVPEEIKFLYYINPVSYTVEDIRNIVIWGLSPNFHWLLIGTLSGLLISVVGFYWFKKTRSGFADVL